jgi:hypothetical protein
MWKFVSSSFSNSAAYNSSFLMFVISYFRVCISSLKTSSSSAALIGFATGGGSLASSRAFTYSGVSTTISFLI